MSFLTTKTTCVNIWIDVMQIDALSLLLIRKNKEEITAAWSFLGSSAAKESSCNAGDPGLIPGFPDGLDSKESACNAGDLGLIPGFRRSPGGGHGNPLQYSCLENPHGQRSLAGYSPQGHIELDMTERLSTAQHHDCNCDVHGSHDFQQNCFFFFYDRK